MNRKNIRRKSISDTRTTSAKAFNQEHTSEVGEVARKLVWLGRKSKERVEYKYRRQNTEK